MMIDSLQHNLKLNQNFSPQSSVPSVPHLQVRSNRLLHFTWTGCSCDSASWVSVLDVKQDPLETVCAVLLFLEVLFSNCHFF